VSGSSPVKRAVTRGITRGGKRGAMPGARNHCGGAEKNDCGGRRMTAGGRRKVPTMSQVLASIQYICFRKISGSNMGVPNLLLPRAPYKLVTPLAVTPPFQVLQK